LNDVHVHNISNDGKLRKWFKQTDLDAALILSYNNIKQKTNNYD
jgi:hypothetical protein